MRRSAEQKQLEREAARVRRREQAARVAAGMTRQIRRVACAACGCALRRGPAGTGDFGDGSGDYVALKAAVALTTRDRKVVPEGANADFLEVLAGG